MTITQFEYIVAVAKHHNFRRAAESCFVTQPTLSVQIQKLEEELNIIIFDRSQSPVKPTRIGALIVEQARVALAEAYKISELVEEDQGQVKGVFRLALIPTVSPYLLPLFLKELMKNYPLLELQIFEMTTDECLKSLKDESVDAAILATKESSKDFFQRNLFVEEMQLYVNKNHSLSKRKWIEPEMLEAKDFWLLAEGHCLRDEIIKFCHLRKLSAGKFGQLNLKIGSLESIRFLVTENGGYTLLPFLTTLKMSDEERKKLRKFKNSVPVRTVNITTRRRYLKQAAVEAVASEIKRSLPNCLKITD